MTKQRYFFLVLILGALTAISPFSIDMYLPAFPAIAKSLHTSHVSFSLASFFVGIALGQLLYGPLLDRFGRKNPLYAGLALYVLASAGCYFSTSIEMLCIWRFIQAVGSCAAGVASLAMVRDIFPVKDNAKVFALLILVLSVSPLLAPTIGGYISAAFGWQIIFIILAGIAILVTLAVIFALPESYPPDPTYSLKPIPIITSFWQVLKNPQFYTYAICGAISFSALFTYLSASPFVFIVVFGLSSKVYGWIFAFLSIGFIGASQVNNTLTRKYKSERIVNISLLCMVIVSAIFLIGSVNNWFGLYGTIGMIFSILCCVGITYPNTSALSLAPFKKNAGTAAALMGVFQMAFGTLVSVVVGLFKNHNTVPMAAIIMAASALAFVILLVGRRMVPEGVGEQVDGEAKVMMH
jgi:DHA1 family bicyclomycin/chloramphenicol resistance-like MFS transporter